MKQIPFMISPPRRLPSERIPTTPIDKEWKTWISHMWWGDVNISHSESDLQDVKDPDGMRVLHDLLLSIGGEETCFPAVEEDLKKILDRGYFMDGRKQVLVKKGRPSQCHANSCDLWEANRDKDLHIMTGYALSQDGMWRQHTWLVQRYETATQKRMRIVETTEKRLAYFGVEYTEEEARVFCEENY